MHGVETCHACMSWGHLPLGSLHILWEPEVSPGCAITGKQPRGLGVLVFRAQCVNGLECGQCRAGNWTDLVLPLWVGIRIQLVLLSSLLRRDSASLMSEYDPVWVVNSAA